MRYSLAQDVFFCAPGGRPVFLDLRNDRYLCLAPEAEQSFRRLSAREPLCADDRTRLDELAADGVLEHCVDGRLSACRGPLPESSAYEADQSPRPASVLHALLRITGSHLWVRLRPLRSSLKHLADRKLASEFNGKPDGEQLTEIAAALRSCSLMTSPLDRCLPRSIATAHMMIDRGLCPELVIGVCLQPFSAHCWVQHGPMLVNDTLDRVRNYTPILVI